MKTSIFDHVELNSIIAFLSSLKLAYAMNNMHAVKTIWLFQLFRKKQATAELNRRVSLKAKSTRKCQNQRALAANCEVVKPLVEAYRKNRSDHRNICMYIKLTKHKTDKPSKYANLLLV